MRPAGNSAYFVMYQKASHPKCGVSRRVEKRDGFLSLVIHGKLVDKP